jgi:hypothetical protein
MKHIQNTHSKKGLLIAAAGLIVLLLLAAYRIPLFHNEFSGTITGISEVHSGTESRLIAAVRLDSGEQVLTSMPRDMQIREDAKARVIEKRTLFGQKSYSITVYSE